VLPGELIVDNTAAASGDNVLSRYRAMISAGRLAADPAQRLAAEQLDRLWRRLRQYDPQPKAPANGWLGRLLNKRRVDEVPVDYPSGLYLVGEVGRGKSMLMDLFFEAADVPRKRRVHFHQFMQETHARLHQLQLDAPDVDPMAALADLIAAESALLCFDEFQIHDIGDGTILARLFQALFDRAVVMVATSNTLPDDLFRGKPGYETLKPFIALLKRHLDVLVLDAARDYRRERLSTVKTWLVPADGQAERALDAVFADLIGDTVPRPKTIIVFGRQLSIPLSAAGVARFDFSALCAQNLGSGDYLAIATQFHTVLIDAVPSLTPDNFDEARRFITLIDALYEHRVKLYASAAAEPGSLYVAGDGVAIFERTVSRLEEMRSATYGNMAHLP
jgi:cell division protein ZapE